MPNTPSVALVTGASRGLGATIARRVAAADGWAVAVNASESAGFVTGERIAVNGGHTIA